MKYLLVIISIWFVATGCQEQEQGSFKSAWDQSEVARHWAGKEYWLNPLQSWKQEGGKLKCIVPGGDRNAVLLTRYMDDRQGSFNMTVNIHPEVNDSLTSEKSGAINNKGLPGGLNSHGWVGFQIGLKGQFNDFRDDAVKGIGLCSGLTSNGNLFIGDLSNTTNILDTLDQVIKLSLEGSINDDSISYVLNISVEDQSGKLLGAHQSIVHKSWLPGMMALTFSQSIPDTLDYLENKPPHQDLNSLNKSVGGNTHISFSKWTVSGSKVSDHEERSYGPILWTQYTLSSNILKMSVQMVPIGNDNTEVLLTIDGNRTYSARLDSLGNNTLFRIEDWNSGKDHSFTVSYNSKDGSKDTYRGTIRKEPFKRNIKVASLSCVDDRGFPHQDLVDNVEAHDPDIYIFHGDQLYERVAGYGVERNSIIDYLRKWYIFGWSFRDAIRDVPSIIIPDDHDVFHGNLWGEGGKRADTSTGYGYDAQDDGGYKEPPAFVNMVHRTQTGHLPDPFDPSSVLQGISVYYTNLDYGGISYAILGDRQWKSAPKSLLPEALIENGWPQNKSWDASISSDVSDAELLGPRQELFLEHWVENWGNGILFKCLVSQSPFANIATLPADIYHDKYVPGLPIYKEGEYPPDDRPVADFDSNSWPQNKRNKALKIIRKAAAIHLAGDQHLGSMGQYGIEEYGDAGYWVATPAVSNLWPRRWMPAQDAQGGKLDGDSRRYSGNFEDGFGNKMTVRGVANPQDIEREPSMVYDKAPGYAIIEFDKNDRNIKVGVWPRWASPSIPSPGNRPFRDWPITINQDDNLGNLFKYKLEPIVVDGATLVKVYNDVTKQLVISYRPKQGIYNAPVRSNDNYQIITINAQGDKRIYDNISVQ